MSYLPDFMLAELCEKHALVTPYAPELVNPASVDLRLGREFVNLSTEPVKYSRRPPAEYPTADWMHLAFPNERFEADEVYLLPGVALLATTLEKVVIPDRSVTFEIAEVQISRGGTVFLEVEEVKVPALVADVKLKSSAARAGLDHALAGWVDPGFAGTLTLEFHAHRPVELVAGKCYVQLCVSTMLAAPCKGYQQTGRYVGEHALGAVLAREK